MKLLKSTDNIVKNYYVKVSKYILYDEELRKMSIGSKLLYIYLTDRWSLSKKNKYANKRNEVYILCKQESLCNFMNVSEKTIRKYFNELKRFNLINIEKQIKGKPNKIYLTDFIECKYRENLPVSYGEKESICREKLPCNNNIINNNYMNKRKSFCRNDKSIYNSFSEDDWNKFYCN